MKKFAFIALLACLFTACAQQTDLSTDSLGSKCTAHCYFYFKNAANIKTPLNPTNSDLENLKVNILYKEYGAEAYAIKSVTPDTNGYVKVQLGCPVGSALEIKVQLSFFNKTLGKEYFEEKNSRVAGNSAVKIEVYADNEACELNR